MFSGYDLCRPAYWKSPCIKETVCKPLKTADINFTSAKSHRKLLVEQDMIKSPKSKVRLASTVDAPRQKDFLMSIAESD